MNKLTNARRTVSTLGLTVLALVATTTAALATTPTGGAAAVNTAVSDAASEATSIVTAGIPVILGVAVLWVALKFGKRLLAKI